MGELCQCGCSVCGAPTSRAGGAFMVVNNRWYDKLQFLYWEDSLASDPRVDTVCGPDHARTVVLTWMRFGRVALSQDGAEASTIPTQESELDTSTARLIGELTIHRETVQRLLAQDPGALSGVLDALIAAMESKASDAVRSVIVQPQPFVCTER